MITQDEYDKAISIQNAYEKALTLVDLFLDILIKRSGNFNPSARDYDVCLGSMKDSISDLFFDDVEEAKKTIELYERQEEREHKRIESMAL